MKNILRWIAVPFAAVLAAIVVNAIGVIYAYINGGGYTLYTGSKVTSITSIIVTIFVQGLVGYAFVKAGAYTAPKYKKITPIVLATVLGCISILSIILIIKGVASGTFDVWAALIATPVGAIYAALTSNDDE